MYRITFRMTAYDLPFAQNALFPLSVIVCIGHTQSRHLNLNPRPGGGLSHLRPGGQNDHTS